MSRHAQQLTAIGVIAGVSRTDRHDGHHHKRSPKVRARMSAARTRALADPKVRARMSMARRLVCLMRTFSGKGGLDGEAITD